MAYREPAASQSLARPIVYGPTALPQLRVALALLALCAVGGAIKQARATATLTCDRAADRCELRMRGFGVAVYEFPATALQGADLSVTTLTETRTYWRGPLAGARVSSSYDVSRLVLRVGDGVYPLYEVENSVGDVLVREVDRFCEDATVPRLTLTSAPKQAGVVLQLIFFCVCVVVCVRLVIGARRRWIVDVGDDAIVVDELRLALPRRRTKLAWSAATVVRIEWKSAARALVVLVDGARELPVTARPVRAPATVHRRVARLLADAFRADVVETEGKRPLPWAFRLSFAVAVGLAWGFAAAHALHFLVAAPNDPSPPGAHVVTACLVAGAAAAAIGRLRARTE